MLLSKPIPNVDLTALLFVLGLTSYQLTMNHKNKLEKNVRILDIWKMFESSTFSTFLGFEQFFDPLESTTMVLLQQNNYLLQNHFFLSVGTIL